MPESPMARDSDGSRTVYRLSGFFDRSVAWELRDEIAREAAPEVILDFSLVREFSDLGIAVLAHALSRTTRRVGLRGLRQHQLRIFRYCGVAVDELASRIASGVVDGITGGRHAR